MNWLYFCKIREFSKALCLTTRNTKQILSLPFMNLFSQVKFLIHKEIVLEWRSKYAFNGILLYVISTVFVCFLAFKAIQPITWNALFWIIMLFASVNAITKSFVQESPGPAVVLLYAGKSAGHNSFKDHLQYHADAAAFHHRAGVLYAGF